MPDDMDQERQPGGVSRRKVLKGGAIAGGVAWVAPTVQVLGIGSAGAQTASPPPPPPPPPNDECKDISNIQVVVSKDGTLYGLKYDDSFEAWSSAAPDSNDCIRYYEQANGGSVVASRSVADAFNRSASVTVVNDCEWRLALPLPAGYTFVAGYVKAGNVAAAECPTAAVVGSTHVAFVGA